MFCDEVLELIEPIAAGDLASDDRVMAHVATCSDCAAALNDARRLDRLLRARPVPTTTLQFTARAITQIRREWWRREELVDIGFNVAIGVGALGFLAVVVVFLYRSGLTIVRSDTVDALRSTVLLAARDIAPSLALYAEATAMILAALAIWWWAERDTSV